MNAEPPKYNIIADKDPSCTRLTLLNGRVKLLQPSIGYRVGIDPVFLAASVPHTCRKLLDVGSGIGSASFCALSRIPNCQTTNIEIVPELNNIAKTNAKSNQWTDRTTFIDGDILQPINCLKDQRFDCIISNPPFFDSAQSNPSTNKLKANARHLPPDMLQKWLNACLKLASTHTMLVFIMRPAMLETALQCLNHKAGAIEIMPLWPRVGRSAQLIIVRAIKGRKTPLQLMHGLVLHNGLHHDDQQAKSQKYSTQAENILRNMHPLFA